MPQSKMTALLASLTIFSACSSSEGPGSDVVGNGVGGASSIGSGGAAAGGTVSSGGTAAGGAVSSGGTMASGGAPSAGGAGSALASGGDLGTGGEAVPTGGASTGGRENGSGGTITGNGGTAAGGGPTGESVFPPSVVTPKIMIVGDSIAAGPGCFKGFLYDDLIGDGVTNFEFVGEYSDDCGSTVRHSAVSCSTAAQYTGAEFTMSNCSQGQSFPGMSTLMSSHAPDMVLLQLGVNDMWGGNTPIQSVLDSYTTLVNQMREHNGNIVAIVAQIHKINTINCGDGSYDSAAEELIEAVPAWAAGLSTEESPVLVADLWTNSSVDETEDCVHPDDAGAATMGENWFNAIADLLR